MRHIILHNHLLPTQFDANFLNFSQNFHQAQFHTEKQLTIKFLSAKLIIQNVIIFLIITYYHYHVLRVFSWFQIFFVLCRYRFRCIIIQKSRIIGDYW